jgi:hypothetical protein
MRSRIAAAIKTAKKQRWITVNENLTDEALVELFVEGMKEVTVREFLEEEFGSN